MWRSILMRYSFLQVLGWTSASISTRWCLVDSLMRPGFCGDQCLRWCTWELTHLHQSCNHMTCHPSDACSVAKPLMSDVKLAGAGFNSHSSELGPAELSSLKTEGLSRRLGIGIMPVPMGSWICADVRLRACSGGLHLPNHLVKLTDRLALGFDGESQRDLRATSLLNGSMEAVAMGRRSLVRAHLFHARAPGRPMRCGEIHQDAPESC